MYGSEGSEADFGGPGGGSGHGAGILIRVDLSWNFGRLVPGVVNSHRYETRTI